MTPPPTDPHALKSLKGLAHPLRVQLLDELSAYGPSTASALAERLGESSGSTSYHLRQLAKHGFVIEDTDRGNARERWWKRIAQPIELSVDAAAGPAERAAGELVFAEWYRSRAGRLQRFVTSGAKDLGPEWVDASRLTTSNLMLTREQAIALHDELYDVITRAIATHRGHEVAGSRPYQIHADVFALVDGVETPANPEHNEESRP